MGGGNKNPLKAAENWIDKNTDSLSSAGRKINKGMKKVGKEIGRATEDVFDFIKAPIDNIGGAIGGGGGNNDIPETETVDPNLLTEEMAKRRKLALAMQRGYMSTIKGNNANNSNIDLLQPNLTGKKTLGQ